MSSTLVFQVNGLSGGNGGGFIPTIFSNSFSVTTSLLIDSIADYISKLNVVNSGANAVYISWATTALQLSLNLESKDSSTAVRIDAGDSYSFFCGTDKRYYGLFSDSGTTTVKVTQGI